MAYNHSFNTVSKVMGENILWLQDAACQLREKLRGTVAYAWKEWRKSFSFQQLLVILSHHKSQFASQQELTKFFNMFTTLSAKPESLSEIFAYISIRSISPEGNLEITFVTAQERQRPREFGKKGSLQRVKHNNQECLKAFLRAMATKIHANKDWMLEMSSFNLGVIIPIRVLRGWLRTLMFKLQNHHCLQQCLNRILSHFNISKEVDWRDFLKAVSRLREDRIKIIAEPHNAPPAFLTNLTQPLAPTIQSSPKDKDHVLLERRKSLISSSRVNLSPKSRQAIRGIVLSIIKKALLKISSAHQGSPLLGRQGTSLLKTQQHRLLCLKDKPNIKEKPKSHPRRHSDYLIQAGKQFIIKNITNCKGNEKSQGKDYGGRTVLPQIKAKIKEQRNTLFLR